MTSENTIPLWQESENTTEWWIHQFSYNDDLLIFREFPRCRSGSPKWRTHPHMVLYRKHPIIFTLEPRGYTELVHSSHYVIGTHRILWLNGIATMQVYGWIALWQESENTINGGHIGFLSIIIYWYSGNFTRCTGSILPWRTHTWFSTENTQTSMLWNLVGMQNFFVHLVMLSWLFESC